VVEIPALVPRDYTTLVVMQTFSSGWRASGPSGRAVVVPIGGFIGVVGAAPGEYVLTFLPLSFVLGVALGVLGAASVAALCVLELLGQGDPS
jgi:hypothetical protein